MLEADVELARPVGDEYADCAGADAVRSMLFVSGKEFHELLIACVHGHRTHPDSSGVADASRIADPGSLTDSAPFGPARGIPTTGGIKMTTATAEEPLAGYDKLKTKELIASLSSHSQVELASIERYERAHQAREAVFDKLRWLRQEEPLPGYDALRSAEVANALEKADVATIKRVRGYERKFAARREVLDEVTRLHQERRMPLASRDATR